MSTFAADTFTRSNQSGSWGTASGGGTWTTFASSPTLSISSNEGHVTGIATDFAAYLGSSTIADVDIVCRMNCGAYNNDAPGIYARVNGTGNWYRCMIGFGEIAFDKKVGGTFTGSFASATGTFTNSTYYWVRFRLQGTTLQAKYWQTGNTEPGTWNLTTTDTGVTSAGNVGVGAFLNATGDFANFDSFTASTLSTAANKSLSLRTRVATTHNQSMSLRTRVSTSGHKSLALRTMAATKQIRSMALRTNILVIITAALVSTVLRTLVATPVHKSVTLRSLINTMATLSMALRTVMFDPHYKSIPLRTIVRGPSDSYTVVSGGEELFVIAGSLTIDSTIGKRSTANFMIHSDTTIHFQQYQQIFIYDRSGNLAFSGYAQQPKEQKPGYQPSLLHTISCIDQHWLADKRVVAASFTNRTCGYIAKWLVDNILAQEGVSIGQIDDGPMPSPTLYPSTTLYPGGNVGIIPECTFVYCSVSQAMDALVTAASSSGIPYYWQIDENRRLWFVPYTSIINSANVDGSTIEEKVSPVTVQRQNPTYRNTQYVLGGVAETLTQTETRKGDGVTQSWTMGYDLAHVPTITINGVAKTVGIKGVDSGKDFYWNKGDPTITQDSSGTILVSTDTLQVVYIGQYPTVIIAQDAGQVAYEASIDNSTGIVESVQQDSTITSAENGMSLASQLINRYAQQALQLQFTTRDIGFSQGQLITVNLPWHDLNDAQMLISDVSASDQYDGINIYYTIQAVQGPYDTSWADFFSKLLKQQAPADSINIGVSQTLVTAALMTANMNTSATFTVNVMTSLLPGLTVYPSSTRYPA
jgi:hypothetical protein